MRQVDCGSKSPTQKLWENPARYSSGVSWFLKWVHLTRSVSLQCWGLLKHLLGWEKTLLLLLQIKKKNCEEIAWGLILPRILAQFYGNVQLNCVWCRNMITNSGKANVQVCYYTVKFVPSLQRWTRYEWRLTLWNEPHIFPCPNCYFYPCPLWFSLVMEYVASFQSRMLCLLHCSTLYQAEINTVLI